MGPLVRKEVRRFEAESERMIIATAAGEEGDIVDFSCGKKALDYGVYAPNSLNGSRPAFKLVVAIDEATGQLMACLKYSLSSGERARSAIQQVRALRKFRHVNIVEYKGACLRDNQLHVLMEMCDGGNIASILSRFGALELGLAVRYTQQILSGLEYLHRHCIIHGHVTCSTCLVTTTGHVKLADFGAMCAMLDEGVPSFEKTMQHVKYPAPELVQRAKRVRQTDIWSAGCCLLEMLTAQEANEAKSHKNKKGGSLIHSTNGLQCNGVQCPGGGAGLFQLFRASAKDAHSSALPVDAEVAVVGGVGGEDTSHIADTNHTNHTNHTSHTSHTSHISHTNDTAETSHTSDTAESDCTNDIAESGAPGGLSPCVGADTLSGADTLTPHTLTQGAMADTFANSSVVQVRIYVSVCLCPLPLPLSVSACLCLLVHVGICR